MTQHQMEQLAPSHKIFHRQDQDECEEADEVF